MSTRPGRRDFVVATDTDNSYAIRFHSRGPQVTVGTIAAGDFIIYAGDVWQVHSVTPVGTQVELVLGFGNFYDPHLTVDADQLVTMAEPATWGAADMQVAMPDVPTSPAPTTLAVPTSIVDGGLTCIILIGPEWLAQFQQAIDYLEGGPSGLSLPYDLVGTFGGQRTRVLTGTIVVVRSAASAPVDPPVLATGGMYR